MIFLLGQVLVYVKVGLAFCQDMTWLLLGRIFGSLHSRIRYLESLQNEWKKLAFVVLSFPRQDRWRWRKGLQKGLDTADWKRHN